MNCEKFARKIVNKLPTKLQHIVYNITIEMRFLAFRIKVMGKTDKANPDPAKVYWISPQRIIYHINYLENMDEETAVPFRDRTFNCEKMRGKVVDGKWDITNYKFAELDVYRSFEKRLLEGVEWQKTEYHYRVLKQIKSGRFARQLKNEDDLNERCRYLDSLVESIRKRGYSLNRNNLDANIAFDEITVNIGRNGEYLFQDGVHRLSIVKILGIKSVPVMVCVRHKKWHDFRKFVVSYAQSHDGGKLYQPIVHPDFEDLPYQMQDHNPRDLMEAIKRNLSKEKGTMLDIGANLGYFCHKFEELGYKCYAVEKDPATYRILEKIRVAEGKNFETINKSIFQVDLVRNEKFDVVLALNIFHHFLKTEADFCQLKELLKNLKTNDLFFEPHRYQEEQMKDAYVNYTETEFVEFLLRHMSLNKSEVIYTAESGRHVFRLSK